MAKYLLVLVFLLGSIVGMSQDTVRLKSSRQEIRLRGGIDQKDSVKYQLELFLSNGQKIVEVHKGEQVSRYVALEAVDGGQDEDSTVVFFDAKQLSPLQRDLRIAILMKGEDIIVVGLIDSEMAVLFLVDPKETSPK